MLPNVKPNDGSIAETKLIGQKPVLIIDDVLEQVRELREAVAKLEHKFGPPKNAYPGVRMAAENFAPAFRLLFSRYVKDTFGLIDRYSQFKSYYSLTMSPEQELASEQTRPHRDFAINDPRVVAIAGIIYLFDDPRLGGTAFYEKLTDDNVSKLPRGAGYQIATDSFFKLEDSCEAKLNRCIIFDATRYHSGHIARPDLLNSGILKGRLTLNFFLKSLVARS
ncbi:MAG: DUF6445 family protein [Parasphingorhabdus sp.]